MFVFKSPEGKMIRQWLLSESRETPGKVSFRVDVAPSRWTASLRVCRVLDASSYIIYVIYAI